MKKKLMVWGLAALVLLVSVSVVSATTWYLTSTSNTTLTGVYYMNETPPTVSGFVSIPSGTYAIWEANQPAQSDVTFQSAIWTGTLVLNIKSGTTANLNVSIGVWDGSSFRSYGHDLITPITGISTFNISANSFTVHKGEWLALRVNNTGSTIVSVREWGSSSTYSTVTYPYSTLYPLSELTSAVLIAVGLFGILAVSFRRFKP